MPLKYTKLILPSSQIKKYAILTIALSRFVFNLPLICIDYVVIEFIVPFKNPFWHRLFHKYHNHNEEHQKFHFCFKRISLNRCLITLTNIIYFYEIIITFAIFLSLLSHRQICFFERVRDCNKHIATQNRQI